MENWIACGANVMVGDVVDWPEPIRVNKGKRKKKLVTIGSQHVTASVTRLEGKDWVHLTVLDCVIKDIQQARPLTPLRKGAAVKRKRSTLARGDARRLPWAGRDGEAVRARLAISSKFLE